MPKRKTSYLSVAFCFPSEPLNIIMIKFNTTVPFFIEDYFFYGKRSRERLLTPTLWEPETRKIQPKVLVFTKDN